LDAVAPRGNFYHEDAAREMQKRFGKFPARFFNFELRSRRFNLAEKLLNSPHLA
jgi:hypothetical protein